MATKLTNVEIDSLLYAISIADDEGYGSEKFGNGDWNNLVAKLNIMKKENNEEYIDENLPLFADNDIVIIKKTNEVKRIYSHYFDNDPECYGYWYITTDGECYDERDLSKCKVCY